MSKALPKGSKSKGSPKRKAGDGPSGRCSHCGERMPLKDGLLPYHDFPKPCRMLCRGAKMPPVESLLPRKDKP